MTTLSSNNHWQTLASALIADNHASIKLENILLDERKTLEDRDYARFESLLTEKNLLLKNLQCNAIKRTQLLHELGFVNASQLLETALADAPNVAEEWQQLEKQWLKCQELNRINERIVKRTDIVVKHSLDILRGQSNNTKLYGANGSTKTVSFGNSLSSA